MHRETLISLLEQVQPALSARQLQPVMGHYWFTGKNLMAFNGDIAISVACPTEFKGAVAPVVLQILKTHRANEVTFEPNDDVLVVKAGRSRIKLPMIGADVFTDVFTMPKFKEKEPLEIDPSKFMRAITSVCMSLGEDTSRSDYMGITFMRREKGFDLYATDLATLSHAFLRMKAVPDWEERFIMSRHFARQLVKIGEGATAIKMEITDGYSMFENHGVRLWGRLEEIDRPLDWATIMEQNFSTKAKNGVSEIPARLAMMLDRACIITEGTIDKTRTQISCVKSKMKLDSVSERGEMHDVLDVGEQQRDVDVSVDPRRVRDGVEKFDLWVVTPKVVAMVSPDDNTTYIVTATT
jgi:DNA polymerase III sliding clamp (beta) subunit (PCNA family)